MDRGVANTEQIATGVSWAAQNLQFLLRCTHNVANWAYLPLAHNPGIEVETSQMSAAARTIQRTVQLQNPVSGPLPENDAISDHIAASSIPHCWPIPGDPLLDDQPICWRPFWLNDKTNTLLTNTISSESRGNTKCPSQPQANHQPIRLLLELYVCTCSTADKHKMMVAAQHSTLAT